MLLGSEQIDETEAGAKRAELTRRVDASEFNGIMTYGSCIGIR